ncbi:hypothetical protein [Fodinicola feengrottensis]|uniref:Uncharacterized protein n=1 Tax=Fodinicola feengrottensis TaxID=435914 RepID=A0ABN2IMI9_9ACTN|nr:hypothetical protein [Fodinicola feengrottensis]
MTRNRRPRADLIAWPNTTAIPTPPAGHPYAAALWLLGRHPMLARLVARVPDLVSRDGQGRLGLDLDELALTLVTLDQHRSAWKRYERDHRAPSDDAAYDQWLAAGPSSTPQVDAISVMSSSELTRVRLLGTFSTVRVPFRVGDLSSFDAEGVTLFADWCTAAAQQ